jgi:hypothetical protein
LSKHCRVLMAWIPPHELAKRDLGGASSDLLQRQVVAGAGRAKHAVLDGHATSVLKGGLIKSAASRNATTLTSASHRAHHANA